MKTKTVKDCPKCREQIRLDLMYEVFSNCVDSAACSVLCMSIWAMELEGKSESDIRRFIEDFKFVAETDKVFNREVRSEDVMKKYAEKYDINFDDLCVNIETKSHFMTRYRKEND